MENKSYKRITIKISKKANYRYDAEKKILIRIKKTRKSRIEINRFFYNLQIILPEYKLSKQQYIKKIITRLSPAALVERVIQFKLQNPEVSLKKALNETEFALFQEISGKIIGSDDDPSRVYGFLGEVLKEASTEIENNSENFVHELTRELFEKGIEF